MTETTALVRLPRWYRVDASSGSDLIYLEEFPVMKTTKRGVWIALPYDDRNRFVLRDAKKRYACPTIDEAIESFLARKKRQLKILRTQVHRVESLIFVAEESREQLKTQGHVNIKTRVFI